MFVVLFCVVTITLPQKTLITNLLPLVLALVDWTGRCVRDDKRGFIPADIKPLFERLAINEEDWLTVIKEFNRHFISAAAIKKN